MKKLLLLTKTFLLSFLFASCQNPPQPQKENVTETKIVIKDSALATDTNKVVNETPSSGTIGTDKGIKKDSIKKETKTHAIIHHAPEEDKIDSIKNAKTKLKKK